MQYISCFQAGFLTKSSDSGGGSYSVSILWCVLYNCYYYYYCYFYFLVKKTSIKKTGNSSLIDIRITIILQRIKSNECFVFVIEKLNPLRT